MNNRRGFSAIEALVAAAVFAPVVVGGLYFMSRLQNASTVAESRLVADSEMRQMIGFIKNAWRLRTRPEAAASAVAPGPFTPTGIFCNGRLVINQRDLATGNLRTLTITTVCANPPTGVVVRGVAHKDLTCPNGVSRVNFTWTGPNAPPNVSFPQDPRMMGATLCFRRYPNEIGVEGGVLYTNQQQSSSIQNRITLSTFDRAAGIEYVK